MAYGNSKLIFGILSLLFSASITCTGQDTPKSIVDSIDNWVQEIKNECDKIKKDSSKFEVTAKDVNELSPEGGLLKKYFHQQTLRKAALTLFGETGQITFEYYFSDGTLIFVYSKQLTYQSSINTEKTEIKSQEENKLYFKDKKLIRWTGVKDGIMSQELYPAKEKEILEDLKIIL